MTENERTESSREMFCEQRLHAMLCLLTPISEPTRSAEVGFRASANRQKYLKSTVTVWFDGYQGVIRTSTHFSRLNWSTKKKKKRTHLCGLENHFQSGSKLVQCKEFLSGISLLNAKHFPMWLLMVPSWVHLFVPLTWQGACDAGLFPSSSSSDEEKIFC